MIIIPLVLTRPTYVNINEVSYSGLRCTLGLNLKLAAYLPPEWEEHGILHSTGRGSPTGTNHTSLQSIGSTCSQQHNNMEMVIIYQTPSRLTC